MASPKRSDTIVINEALAFIQCKLDVMDQVSLTQILTSSYTEAQIVDAKKVLYETSATTIRLITRQRDGRGKKDIEDIFKVFLETDPDDLPTYVIRDVSRLPPVTWDHVDVSCVLKKINQLEADVTSIRAKLEVSEKTVSELKQELVTLRNKNAAPTISPESARNVTARRGATRHLTSPVSNIVEATTPDTDSQVNDRPAPISAPGMSTKKPATIVPSPAPRAHQQKKSYAQVSRQPQPPRPVPSAVLQRMSHAKLVAQKVDENGFTLVEKKHRPKRSRNQRGTAPDSLQSLQVVEPSIGIYISRLDPTTTGDKILWYVNERVRSKLKQVPEGLVLGLKRLESSRATNFKSYVLQVAAKYKEMFLESDFWTTGIVYRRYREARPTKKIP